MAMDKLLLPDEIKGERIVLKKNAVEQAEEIFLCADSDREHLRPFLMWVDKVKTLDDEIKFIEGSDSWKGKPMRSYGIFYKDKYVGNIGAHSIVLADNKCELGYWIHSKYEGKGLVSEAISLLEKTLFSAGFTRIEAYCATQNTRSIKLAERNGYKLEGKIKEKLFEDRDEVELMIFAKNILED